ncbi:MAG: DUF4235 domain-containing protein [Streptosporangiaceae bacterium]
MAGKQGGSSRAVNALTGAAAAFGARKLITFGWKKLTGKEPPEHPEDPQVALREALIWGIVLGATVSTARMLAMRATMRRAKDGDGPPA